MNEFIHSSLVSTCGRVQKTYVNDARQIYNGILLTHNLYLYLPCEYFGFLLSADKEFMLQVYISSRTAKECDATAKELTALGPGICVSIPADMQKLEEVERLVKEIGAHENTLHVLVNNAGAAWGASVDEFPVSCRP